MRLDIHVHTSERSPCSFVPAREAINRAKESQLDGLILTDHNYTWRQDDLDKLREDSDRGLLILSGQEYDGCGQHFLVFGLPIVSGIFLNPQDLVQAVHDQGGMIIVAHPFDPPIRWNLERIKEMGFDGIELYNACRTAPTQVQIQEAGSLGLATLGGSDYHGWEGMPSLGTCYTSLEGDCQDLDSFLLAVRNLKVQAHFSSPYRLRTVSS
ncbi:MAG: hypothetical protein HY730_10040 [Candidatus Tectomicrobia bacterium]|uniref:Polymerase/histidinol phosphatase N-terminal domain-containing protein n=1 Tax=Tectimicrobiota bacterium TaxID=2528274 RepID=A0A933GPY8_UNCTE|nr:hypothetical protein [Candidatus Tectomicrobia bacterium]